MLHICAWVVPEYILRTPTSFVTPGPLNQSMISLL